MFERWRGPAFLLAMACGGGTPLDQPHEPPVWPIRTSEPEERPAPAAVDPEAGNAPSEPEPAAAPDAPPEPTATTTDASIEETP